MKVLYDHQAFTMQYFGGVSKCFVELISCFPNEVCAEIGIVQSNNVHLVNSGLCDNIIPVCMDVKTFCNNYRFRGNGRLYLNLNKLLPFLRTAENINKQKSIAYLKEGNFNVFHPTFFDDYFLPYLNGKPFVLTVHDMMPELFPQYFKKNDFQIVKKRKLAGLASAIVAVSAQTKMDLMNILAVPEEKITVIHHGGPKKENIQVPSLIQFPYFLYMGTRTVYKNFHRLIMDFAKLSERYKNILLVCTGEAFSQKELAFLKKEGVTDKVIHMPVNDEEAKILYTYAIAFVYPSLYEGFGMPILEAFACGCPVLLNRSSCFPEVAGDAGIFFSDDNESELLGILEQAIQWTDEERDFIKEKGYKRLRHFTWDTAAAKLIAVYQSVL